ncbi:hypothetical protein QR680_011369 [Steinernema hermaphroditum]|uniref:Uncharacterized protein n=1 Tax=Steinernema hermaphroditum TaxID=289476 RepID=A0AA39ITH0_9BILA|nr:hypothetical protein QR680_011369 [Steinernema hermaphroditum]
MHHVNLQDKTGKTLLIHCCAKGQAKIVEELSKNPDIDVNIGDNEGNTALIFAAQAGHTLIVQLLIQKFPTLNIDQVNKVGQSALIKSAIQGRIGCAKALLKAGADPYKRDYSRGFCALEWAEYVSRTECAHAIAHYMIEPFKSPPQKLSKATPNLKEVARVVAVPIFKEVPIARPRLNSAPIPTFKIISTDGRCSSKPPRKMRPARPSSSLA